MAYILVLEDEEGFQLLLKEILTEARHEVTPARSGAEALNLLHQQRFDLFLIDNRMPGITGLEFLKQLRASGDQTPAIIMTAYAEVPVVVEAMRQGAFEFLVKPFPIEALLPLVDQGLQRAASPSA